MITLENGDKITPKDTDPVHCDTHDLTVHWGDLDAIQQLAVEEGLDTVEDLPCILTHTTKDN